MNKRVNNSLVKKYDKKKQERCDMRFLRLFLILTLFCGSLIAKNNRHEEEEIFLQETIFNKVFMCVKILEAHKTCTPTEIEQKFTGDQGSQIYRRVIDFCAKPLNKEVPSFLGIKLVYKKLVPAETLREFQNKLTASRRALSLTKILPETKMVAGISDFLIKRAQSEVVGGFLRDMRQLLKKERYKRLFPNSYNVLYDTGSLTLETMLPTFRAAIIEDFKIFPQNILELIRNSIGEDLIRQLKIDKKKGEIERILESYDKKMPVKEIFSKLSKEAAREKIESFPKVKQFVEKYALYEVLFTEITRRYLEIEKGMNPLLSVSKFYNLAADEEENSYKVRNALIIFGLLTKEIYYSNKIGFTSKWESMLKEYLEKNNKSSRLFCAFFINKLQKEKNIKVGEAFKVSLSKNIIPIIDSLMEMMNRYGIYDREKKQFGFPVVKGSLLLKDTILCLKESAALEIPGEAMAEIDKICKTFENFSGIKRAITNRNFNLVIVHVVDLTSTYLPEDNLWRKKVLPFLAVISNIAAAKDTQAVAKAMVDFTAPKGSYQLKRRKNSRVYFTANSYFGVSGGWERLSDKSFSTGMHGSVFVPVGLEIGLSTGGKWLSTVGLFGSVIDVGTQVSYRLSDKKRKDGEDNNVSANPEIGFAQVFSPSAYLVLGITRKYPVSVGVGLQYIPNHREIVGTEMRVNTHRLSFFIAVDLTLIKL